MGQEGNQCQALAWATQRDTVSKQALITSPQILEESREHIRRPKQSPCLESVPVAC